MEIPKNVAVLSVERPGAIDRRGQTVYETAYARTWARLERVHRMARDQNGDTVNIDAVLWADDMNLRARDLITIDNVDKDRYVVFAIREENDVDATQYFQKAELVKQR